jgi:hypothetical protein
MKDDNLSDVQKMKCPEYSKLPKRSDCRCSCHNDIGGYSAMHVMPCCELDDNPVNCPHGIEMDVYCEQCERFNPPQTAEQMLNRKMDIYDPQSIQVPNSVGIEVYQKLLDDYSRAVWNVAIETAAGLCEHDGYTVGKIRELKK